MTSLMPSGNATRLAGRGRAEAQVGCLAGTLNQAEYVQLLEAAGFSGITVSSTSQAAEVLAAAITCATKLN
jgi:hypothetical protein